SGTCPPASSRSLTRSPTGSIVARLDTAPLEWSLLSTPQRRATPLTNSKTRRRSRMVPSGKSPIAESDVLLLDS
ncbi:hypothetical protein RSAG8_11678, partial [Rhizoctonia solani AG-8 WAC10335]